MLYDNITIKIHLNYIFIILTLNISREDSGGIMEYIIKELSAETWHLFEELAERHNGVWGGCWCTWFHQSDSIQRGDSETNRKLKQKLVNEGKAHAALVCIDDKTVAWCQYGTPDELPAIYHKKEVEETGYERPDWRITCIFVDKKYRHKGLARIAVEGALVLIKNQGGGIVESYPQDTHGQQTSSSFLYNATKSVFIDCGFEYLKSKGKNHTIMRKII